MVFDVALVFANKNWVVSDTYHLKCESLDYEVDRRIKVYEMPIFKALSQALGGDIWSNIMTDWGVCIESFNLTGIINEGNKVASFNKMMELSHVVRVLGFNSYRNVLYMMADPTKDVTDKSTWCLHNGLPYGSRMLMHDKALYQGDTGFKGGLECKINKIKFQHEANVPAIRWNMQIIIGFDYEFTS